MFGFKDILGISAMAWVYYVDQIGNIGKTIYNDFIISN